MIARGSSIVLFKIYQNDKTLACNEEFSSVV